MSVKAISQNTNKSQNTKQQTYYKGNIYTIENGVTLDTVPVKIVLDSIKTNLPEVEQIKANRRVFDLIQTPRKPED